MVLSKMRTIYFLKAIAVGMMVHGATATDVAAAEGRSTFADRCLSCHSVTGPAPSTFAGVLNRKAPDLFYAGSKFNRPWLVEWLQNPSMIRRSGVMFLNHIVTENGNDAIRTGAVKPCPANLSPEEAVSVAGYLMTLTDSSMKTGVIDPARKFRKSKARRLFAKQYPCVGCHIARFGKKLRGGVSGPDLREAGKRLNPDWVYARIENPQHWDPKTWMPKLALSHKKRELLTLFVGSMK